MFPSRNEPPSPASQSGRPAPGPDGPTCPSAGVSLLGTAGGGGCSGPGSRCFMLCSRSGLGSPGWLRLQWAEESFWWLKTRWKKEISAGEAWLSLETARERHFIRRHLPFMLPWGRTTLDFPRVLYLRAFAEKAMAPHSSTLAWKIPWTEELGRLQSVGSLRRVRYNWATSLSLFTFTHWRRKWQPTPVFLPGESQGRGSLVGCRLWGRTESDMTEAT